MVADGVGSGEAYLIVAVMFTYAILIGLISNPASLAASLIVSTIAYFMGIYLYYGVARLAFSGRDILLWTGGTLAFVTSYSVSGLTSLWSLVTAWSMILIAGTAVGRLSFSGRRQLHIYTIGLLIVAAFAIAQFWPLWNEMMSTASTLIEQLVQDAREKLMAREYGVDAVSKSLDSSERMLNVMVRLIPIFTILGSVLPFTVAYLIFSYRLKKMDSVPNAVAPFVLWKMPFAVMPILIVTILMRLFGSEVMKLTADNMLAFLALFYSVTGLALIEYYLRKLNFSTFLKVMFYIVFFLSQLIGLFLAAFLGFVDSFLDWRKVQQLSLERK